MVGTGAYLIGLEQGRNKNTQKTKKKKKKKEKQKLMQFDCDFGQLFHSLALNVDK